MKKRIFAIAMIMVLAMGLAACKGSDDSKDAKETFTVGFDKEFPPYGFVDEKGNYVGFDLDLAAEAAERMGMELKLQPIAWESKDLELSSGTIDCIWNGFTMDGRLNDYEWTKAYMHNSQIFVVKDSSITTFADLAGKSVAVQTDSSALKALNNNTDLKGSFKELVEVADYNTAFMNLESGAVDAIAMDIGVAQYQIKTRGVDFKILKEELTPEEYGVGFLKENTELRDKVQKTLEEMSEDGTFAKISNKWFGEDVGIIGK